MRNVSGNLVENEYKSIFDFIFCTCVPILHLFGSILRIENYSCKKKKNTKKNARSILSPNSYN